MIHRDVVVSYFISFVLNFTIYVFSLNFFAFGDFKKNLIHSFSLTLDTSHYERDFIKDSPNQEKIITNELQKNLQVQEEKTIVNVSKKIVHEKTNLSNNKQQTSKIYKNEPIQKEKNQNLAYTETNKTIDDNLSKSTDLIDTEFNNSKSGQYNDIEGQNKHEEGFLIASIDKKVLPKEFKFGSANGPNFKEKVEPVYPIKARRLGKEGQVKVKLHIDEEGKLIDIIFLSDPGYGFKESVLQALLKSTFIPATENGKPIPSIALLTISFKLED